MKNAISMVMELAKKNNVEIHFYAGGVDIYTSCDLPGIENRSLKPKNVEGAVKALSQLVKTGWTKS